VPDHARFRGAAGDAPEFTDLGPSDWSLTFDTETLTDASQRLRIGTYQVRRGEGLVQAGVFLDPEVLTPSEIETVHQHADARGWRVRTLTDFVDDVFYPLALELGGLVIRFNLPFDISRLAYRPRSREEPRRKNARRLLLSAQRQPEASSRTGQAHRGASGLHPACDRGRGDIRSSGIEIVVGRSAT
jgi:hypothetical protein